jgi:hypothetical protein
MGAASRRPARSEVVGAVRPPSVRLSTGAHVVLFIFQFIQNRLNLEIENEGITLLQKFPNFACG